MAVGGSVSVQGIGRATEAADAAGPLWTDIVTAFSALAALIIASIAAYAAFKTNEQQSKQLKRLEDDGREQEQQRLRAHADRVASWVAGDLSVWLINQNNQPVYDVSVWFTKGDQSWTWKRAVVKPFWDDSDALKPITDEIREACRREYTLGLGLPLEYDSAAYEQASYDLRAAWQEWAREGISIKFRDVAGNTWVRHRDGQLRQLKTTPH